MQPEPRRCPWAKTDLEIIYHDQEWGKPSYDDEKLFELLILEGFQAGLSWASILNKREDMRKAFDNFNPHKLVNYDDLKRSQLLANPLIIRNRAKIKALTTNAASFLATQKEFGTFSQYLWNFVDGRPVLNHWNEQSQVPAESPLSQSLSRDLKQRGFKFVGPVICYAYMQATGLINDHLISCPHHQLCQSPNPAPPF